MLTTAATPARPVGQVLMLHGGAERGHQPVDGRSLALRRTRAMYGAIAPRLTRQGVIVSLLRFSVRGWNDAEASPVADTRAALDTLSARHPGLGVVLVGHSMGARAAAWAADHPAVAGVVGLAPWFPPQDPVDALAGRHLVAAHGSRDRITSARATRRYLERAAEVAASVRFVDMGPRGHYLLTGVRRWNEIAVAEPLAMLDVGTVTSRD